ncbi:MAG: HAD hydrolase family protein [Nitrososphaerota archaeon]|nr:HAD hydrolase family protein [Candidatus Geocrenenecus dongiae]
MRSSRAIVLDLDGTLTKGGEERVAPELRSMLEQFKRDGWLLILATGRDKKYLESRDDLRNLFDGWVCEAGISIYIPSTNDYRILVDERWLQFISEVKRKVKCVVFKENTVNLLSKECIGEINEIASRIGVHYKVLNNKGSLLLLPTNTDKYTGLNELLRLMDFHGYLVVIGDSEIDIEILKNADFKAAPSNADQAVKEIVDYLSSGEDGEGVIEILRNLRHKFKFIGK